MIPLLRLALQIAVFIIIRGAGVWRGRRCQDNKTATGATNSVSVTHTERQ